MAQICKNVGSTFNLALRISVKEVINEVCSVQFPLRRFTMVGSVNHQPVVPCELEANVGAFTLNITISFLIYYSFLQDLDVMNGFEL